MIWSSVVSGVVGGGTALFQLLLEKKQELKRLTIEKEFELKRLELNYAQRVPQEALQELEVPEQAISIAPTYEAPSELLPDPAGVALDYHYKQFIWASFITSITRPLITFYFTFAVTALAIIAVLQTKEMASMVLEASFVTLDYIIGFWFVRRSSEKLPTRSFNTKH